MLADSSNRFRWAACQLDALKDCHNLKTLRKAPLSLPENLDETYFRISSGIRKANLAEATTILQLLVYSDRPLRLEEAIDAIAVDSNETPGFNPENRMPSSEDMLRICSSLVTLVSRVWVNNGLLPLFSLLHVLPHAV